MTASQRFVVTGPKIATLAVRQFCGNGGRSGVDWQAAS